MRRIGISLLGIFIASLLPVFANAATDTFGYICESSAINCDASVATFAVYQQDSDTFIACTPDAPVCNSANAIYTAVRDSGNDFYICKGGFPICNVGNGDYYMEKNDSTSFYVCKGQMPVCNVANGNYYIEKDDSSTWDICEGSMPVCNFANDSYIFKKVLAKTTYTPPAMYEAERKPTVDTPTAKASKIIESNTAAQTSVEQSGATTTIAPETISFQATSNEPISKVKKPSIVQRFIAWILSFF